MVRPRRHMALLWAEIVVPAKVNVLSNWYSQRGACRDPDHCLHTRGQSEHQEKQRRERQRETGGSSAYCCPQGSCKKVFHSRADGGGSRWLHSTPARVPEPLGRQCEAPSSHTCMVPVLALNTTNLCLCWSCSGSHREVS